MIKIRVDDFPNTKGEPQHTLDAFAKFNDTLLELTGGKKYLLGVIPSRLNTEAVHFLRNESHCIVGMHGVDHDERCLDAYNNEFPSYLTQYDVRFKMQRGKDIVENIRKSTIYMPPRNIIDKRTWDAAKECGFRYYTVGPETKFFAKDEFGKKEYIGGPTKCYENDDNGKLMITTGYKNLYGRTDEISCANYSQYVTKKEAYVLTLHWTWETNIGLEHMKRFFRTSDKDYILDFDSDIENGDLYV